MQIFQSASVVGDLVRRTFDGLSYESVFGLVASGKREAFLRDLFARAVTLDIPMVLTKPEWDIPPDAARRWESQGMTKSKTKGIVDLAVLPVNDLMTSQPLSLFEFKVWYTGDACSDSKYRANAQPHHSIPKAHLVDVEKIRSVRDGGAGDDYVVTFLNTVHSDEINDAGDNSLHIKLEELGVAYARALHTQTRLLRKGFRAVREEGIGRALAEISKSVSAVTHVACGRWEAGPVPISVDCLISVP